MADSPQTVLDQVQKAKFAEREQEREAAGGGKALSPRDAAGMGASPDQAKMVGATGPSNLQAAADQAMAIRDVAQEDQLGAVLRERTLEDVVMSQAQQTKQATLEKFEGLGGALDAAVQQLVTDEFDKATNDNVMSSVSYDLDSVVDQIAIDGASDEQKSTIRNALTSTVEGQPGFLQLVSEGKTTEAFEAIEGLENTADGSILKDINPDSLIEVLQSSMTNATEDEKETVVAEAIARDIIDPEEVTLGALLNTGMFDMEGLGFSVNEIGTIFGDDYENLTVGEISHIMENKQRREMKTLETAHKHLADPNVPDAIKEGLQQKVARMEASGEAALEQNAEEAVSQMMAAEHVMFGGEMKPIEELLDDDNIIADVEDYLSLELEEREGHPLAENSPQFSALIDDVFDKVDRQAEDVGNAIQEFKDINAEWTEKKEEFKETVGKFEVIVSDEVIEMMTGESGLVTSVPESDDFWKAAQEHPSVIRTMNGWDEATRDKFRDFIKNNKDTTGLLEALKDPSTAQAMLDVQNITERLAGADTLEKVLRVALGDGTVDQNKNLAEILQNPEQAWDRIKLENSGGTTSYLMTVLDANKDGKMDDMKTIKASLAAKFSNPGDMAKILESSKELASVRDSAAKGRGFSTTNPEAGLPSFVQTKNAIINSGAYKDGVWDINKLMDTTASGKEGTVGGRAAFLDSVLRSGMLPEFTTDPKDPKKRISAKALVQRKLDELSKEASGFNKVTAAAAEVEKNAVYASAKKEAAALDRQMNEHDKAYEENKKTLEKLSKVRPVTSALRERMSSLTRQNKSLNRKLVNAQIRKNTQKATMQRTLEAEQGKHIDTALGNYSSQPPSIKKYIEQMVEKYGSKEQKRQLKL